MSGQHRKDPPDVAWWHPLLIGLVTSCLPLSLAGIVALIYKAVPVPPSVTTNISPPVITSARSTAAPRKSVSPSPTTRRSR